MSTVRSLVNRAHRYLKTYGSGETPSDDDGDIGLEELQLYLKQNVAKGVFGPLTDVVITEAYEAGENERIANLTGSALTVTLPDSIVDDVTGDDRAPEDRAVVIVAGDSTSLYDATLAAWVNLDTMTLNDDEPLAGFNLAWPLALQMSESFGLEPGPVLVAKAATTQAALRLKKPIRVTAPLAVLQTHATRGRLSC